MTAAICIVCSLAAFLFGKIHERAAWNQLISDGILPKPRAKQ